MTARPYRLKRAVDLVILGALALPVAVVGGAIAAAVALTSKGPVFFTQERIGRNGEPFVCFKFRTMLDGDNPLIPNDDRITTVGRWLRRFSIDELPQLINVARGEMSIVGPRPMQPFQADRCDQRQHGRHAVRPGLTGIAQISGRNALSWPDRIELDLEYVERRSAWLDLRIIWHTARAVITGDGVGGHSVSDLFVIDPDTYQHVVSVTERRERTERRRRERRVRNVAVASDRRLGDRRAATRRNSPPELRIRSASTKTETVAPVNPVAARTDRTISLREWRRPRTPIDA